jgi:YD repeat-containing protein
VTNATFRNTQSADVDLPDTVTQVRRNQGGGTTNITTTVGYDSLGEPTSVTDPTGAGGA